jgi:threonine/homoserine/homoserine lactone efflux protein
MDFIYFLKGLIIGFALPIPLGPVGILCIRRTLAYGILYGFLTGLSAAISDILFNIAAAFGITLVFNFVTEHQQVIRLVGGIVLFVLGYRTFRPHSVKKAATKHAIAPALAFFSTFLITFTNPMALLAYAAVFAGVGIQNLARNQITAVLFIAGIFIGSLSWFSLLTFMCHIFKEKITTRGLTVVDKAAGSLLILFGVAALWSGLSGF